MKIKKEYILMLLLTIGMFAYNEVEIKANVNTDNELTNLSNKKMNISELEQAEECNIVNSDIGVQCIKSDGNKLVGWKIIGDNIFYFDEINGVKAVGDKIIDGKSCYFDQAKGIVTINGKKITGKKTFFAEFDGNTVNSLESDEKEKSNESIEKVDSLVNSNLISPSVEEKKEIEVKLENDNQTELENVIVNENNVRKVVHEKGFTKIGDDYYFINEDGSYYNKGWKEINGWKYYFGEDTKALKGWQIIDGKRYCFFTGNAGMAIGIQKFGNDYYYFNGDGTMRTGWTNDYGHKYYFQSNGRALIGNNIINKKEYIFLENGEMLEGFGAVNNGYGDIYYIDKEGNVLRGWKQFNGWNYYFGEDAKAIKGWQTIDGKRYCFFTENAGMAIGIQKFGNDYYYFNGDGTMRTGWTNDYGHKYYFQSNGIAIIGDQILDSKQYYFENNGVMHVGWLDLYNGISKYYKVDGEIVKGKCVINRIDYSFDENDGRFLSMNANIPYFSQRDPRWAKKVYGDYYFDGSGCVPTSAAMILSFLKNRTILPTELGDFAYADGCFNNYEGAGTSADFIPKAFQNYGIKHEGNLSLDEIILALRHGKLIMAAMNPPFTAAGTTHEIVLRGINANNIVSVYDPYYPEHNTEYSIEEIFKCKSTAAIDNTFGGPFFAIG